MKLMVLINSVVFYAGICTGNFEWFKPPFGALPGSTLAD